MPAVAAAVVTVSYLAVLDASLGSKIVLGGLLAVGPCLTAAQGRPRAVAAVGAYAMVLVSVLAWWPDRIVATLHHVLYLASVAAVTLVSMWIARRHRQLELVIGEADERTAALQRAAEFSDEAIISTTVDGTVLAWNAGEERLYG